MISALFVDRPRLAIVISVVLTIAGLLSLIAMPIAQYPDIVLKYPSPRSIPAPMPRWWTRPSPSRSKRRSSASTR
jgi:hypothetical protein